VVVVISKKGSIEHPEQNVAAASVRVSPQDLHALG